MSSAVTSVAGGSAGWADGSGSMVAFFGVSGLAVDASGTIFAADIDNHMVRRVTPSGGMMRALVRPSLSSVGR